MDAYEHQITCVQNALKMLQAMKDSNSHNWFLPIMYTVCIDLRLLAQKYEKFEANRILKPGEILEKAALCLVDCFRVCANDNR